MYFKESLLYRLWKNTILSTEGFFFYESEVFQKGDINLDKAHAKVKAILIGDQPDSFITRRIPQVMLEFGGLKGDRHFGLTRASDSRQPMYPRGTEIFNRRQITIVSEEDCAQIAKELGVEQVLPEWLGANLIVTRFQEWTRLPMGSRILFPSGAGLICMGENLPCIYPGEEIQKRYIDQPKLAARFVKAGYHRRGIVCAVECPGEIAEGEEIEVFVNDFEHPMQ